jgi:hypothetical protein
MLKGGCIQKGEMSKKEIQEYTFKAINWVSTERNATGFNICYT